MARFQKNSQRRNQNIPEALYEKASPYKGKNRSIMVDSKPSKGQRASAGSQRPKSLSASKKAMAKWKEEEQNQQTLKQLELQQVQEQWLVKHSLNSELHQSRAQQDLPQRRENPQLQPQPQNSRQQPPQFQPPPMIPQQQQQFHLNQQPKGNWPFGGLPPTNTNNINPNLPNNNNMGNNMFNNRLVAGGYPANNTTNNSVFNQQVPQPNLMNNNFISPNINNQQIPQPNLNPNPMKMNIYNPNIPPPNPSVQNSHFNPINHFGIPWSGYSMFLY